MATPGFLSKRVKRKPQTGITTDRYQFLGLDQAEPDLGDPLIGPSSIGANPVPPTGVQYVLVAYGNQTGKRYWSASANIVGSGLIPGSFTIFNNDVQVGLANSFNKFNFVGTGVTVDPVGFAVTQQTGIATVRITVTDLTGPGNVYSIPYKETNNLLAGANDFVYVSGNVGIGTTNPTEKLSVYGAIESLADNTSPSTEGGQLILRGKSGTLTRWNIDNYSVGVNTNLFRIFKEDNSTAGSNGRVYVGITTIGEFIIGNGVGGLSPTRSANQQFQVQSGAYISGSVGIGTTTPTSKLHVVGNVNITGIVTAAEFVGSFTGIASTANNLSNAANITTGTISSSRLSGSYGIDIIGTATTANNLSNAANITTGTISSSRLSGSYGIDIIGTATTANNVSSTININTTGIITAVSFYGNLVGNISTTGQSFETITVTGVSTFNNGPILLGSVNSTGTALQRLQVTGGSYISGSVGIGTTNPTSKLHVIGDANITGIVTASRFVGSGSSLSGLVSNVIAGVNTDFYHYFLISPQGSGTISSISASLNYIIFNPASKFLGIGTDSPSANLDVFGTGKFSTSVTSLDFNTTSDSKLKTNIHQIENSLEKVIQIRGVTFEWKENNKSSAGVIAQDVEKVLPEVVSGEDVKTVNYNGIVGALVEAVKELKVENDMLKEKLEKVYSKVFGEDTL